MHALLNSKCIPTVTSKMTNDILARGGRPLDWSSLGFVGDASIESWADSIRRIKSRYAGIATVVPGHGSVGDAELLDHTIHLAELAAEQSAQPAPDASAD